jgi:hypothetical protein
MLMVFPASRLGGDTFVRAVEDGQAIAITQFV